MATFSFLPMPADLTPDQRTAWQRRQRTAQDTLEIHALAGTEPNAGTVAQLQRYVSGEITLADAIAQVREQMAQEHPGFRQYLDGRPKA